MSTSSPAFSVQDTPAGERVVSVSGDWTIWTIGALDARLRRVDPGTSPVLDLSGLGRIDTSGAYILNRTLSASGAPFEVRGAHGAAHSLLSRMRAQVRPRAREARPQAGLIALLDRAGHGALDAWRELLGILSFIGEAAATLVRLAVRPHRIRWTSVVAIMEEAGLDALPIVCFLSFFVGLVIAFIGANLLAMFNAAVFVVELVGIGMLREFGVVLTAILLAGRTDSAFTAQIGAMKMRQEIDAMRIIGLDPMEALVAPRLIALLVLTPILSFAATIAGVAGGLVAAWAAMDISPALFIARFRDVVGDQHFWVGLVKAPVFALVIALVGCRQGLLVESDVTSLGRRTTAAVVQSIFLVIVLDAMFAIVYYLMDV